jgi:hypothetical protein
MALLGASPANCAALLFTISKLMLSGCIQNPSFCQSSSEEPVKIRNIQSILHVYMAILCHCLLNLQVLKIGVSNQNHESSSIHF